MPMEHTGNTKIIQLNGLNGSSNFEESIGGKFDHPLSRGYNRNAAERSITVSVLTVSGASFLQPVDPLSTVAAVKQQVADTVNITPDSQLLFLDDSELKDDTFIFQSNVIEGSVLKVAARKQVQVSVTLEGHDALTLETPNSVHIRELLDHVAESFQELPFNMSLWKGGRRLDRSQALCMLIGVEEMVQLEAGICWLQLTVLVSSCVDFPVRVTNTDTVGDIKKKVREKLGTAWDPDNYLAYNGEKLEEDRLLTEYSVPDDSILLVNGENKIALKCQTMTRIENIIVCDMTASISQVKACYSEETGVPPDQLRLVHAGRQLDDDKQLPFYSIRDSAIVFVLFRLRGGGGRTLLVLNNHGQSVRVPVYATDTVKDVKVRIENMLGIPPEKQELVIYDERIMGKREEGESKAAGTCLVI